MTLLSFWGFVFQSLFFAFLASAGVLASLILFNYVADNFFD